MPMQESRQHSAANAIAYRARWICVDRVMGFQSFVADPGPIRQTQNLELVHLSGHDRLAVHSIVGSTGSINSKEHVLLVGERGCLNDGGVQGYCKGREVFSFSYNLRHVLIHGSHLHSDKY